MVYENAKAGTAYVVESKLKVMLEEDYLALEKSQVTGHKSQENKILLSFPNVSVGNPENAQTLDPRLKHSGVTDVSNLGSQIIREIVIPELTKEVNQGQNFSQLRQVYNSLILATWYKKKIKDSILEQVYADKKKVAGVGYEKSVILSEAKDLKVPKDSSVATLPQNDNDVELIYQRYLQAFKKGAYNYIKEEVDPISQHSIPRKYFSGGVVFRTDLAMTSIMPNINPKKFFLALTVQIRKAVAQRKKINPWNEYPENKQGKIWESAPNIFMVHMIYKQPLKGLESILPRFKNQISLINNLFPLLPINKDSIPIPSELGEFTPTSYEDTAFVGGHLMACLKNAVEDFSKGVFKYGKRREVKAYLLAPYIWAYYSSIREFKDWNDTPGILKPHNGETLEEVLQEYEKNGDLDQFLSFYVGKLLGVSATIKIRINDKERTFNRKSKNILVIDFVRANDPRLRTDAAMTGAMVDQPETLKYAVSELQTALKRHLFSVFLAEPRHRELSVALDVSQDSQGRTFSRTMVRVYPFAKDDKIKQEQGVYGFPELKGIYHDLQLKDEFMPPSGTIGQITFFIILDKDGHAVLVFEENQPSYGFRRIKPSSAQKPYFIWVEALQKHIIGLAKQIGINQIYALSRDAISQAYLYNHTSTSTHFDPYKRPYRKPYWQPKMVDVSTIYPFWPPGKQISVWEYVNPAMTGEKADRAMNAIITKHKGGIDLSSDKALSVQNSGQGIKFHLDPAQLEQLQNAPGFVPVIINIQPLKSLSGFLGLNQTAPQASDNLPKL